MLMLVLALSSDPVLAPRKRIVPLKSGGAVIVMLLYYHEQVRQQTGMYGWNQRGADAAPALSAVGFDRVRIIAPPVNAGLKAEVVRSNSDGKK